MDMITILFRVVCILGLLQLLVVGVSASDMMYRHEAIHTGNYSSPAGTARTAVSQNGNYSTGDTADSSPVVANGLAYLRSMDNAVYALNATMGVPVWNYSTGAGVESGTIVANRSVSVVTSAAPASPYFPNPNSYHVSEYYWPTGGVYAHELGEDVTNGGGAGNVFYSFYGDYYALSSVVFWMDPGETVTVWSYYSGAPKGGWIYANVRCATAADGNVSDTRVERWTPPPPGASIQVITPNGGENWSSGETRTITWTTTGLEGTHVGIDLCRWDGSAWVSNKGIIGGVSATDNSYEWVIPPLPAPDSYKIEISSSEYHGLPTDLSDNPFTAGGSDASPPRSITGLHNSSYAAGFINWTWTDPTDPDFDHVRVYIGGVFKGNYIRGYYNATGLSANTEYTIGTRTVDTVGNVNGTWVNHTARTAPGGGVGGTNRSGISVFRPSTHMFYLDNDGNGAWDGAVTDRAYNFGLTGDIPVSGDWNLDGRTEIGVFRPSTHMFYLDYSSNGAWNGAVTDRAYNFGLTGDIPVSGDWNLDGRTEIGVFRPSTHMFYLDYSSNGAWNGAVTDRAYNLGLTGDIPVSGDWNLDGRTEIGVFRPSTHMFYLDYSSNGAWNGAVTDRAYNFGITGDIPVSGDWSADGISEIGVFRPSTHMFYLDYSGNGVWNGAAIDRAYNLGITGDIPVSGRWA
jgi:hypothetical protein